jgi:hypothetical protein
LSYQAIELKFEPTGPLVDGSTGRIVIRTLTPDNHFAEDIPVGAYKVTATLVETDGARSPLKVGPSGKLADETAFEFKAPSSCGGNFGNGTEREFLYIGRP